MSNICLVPSEITKFKEALKNHELDMGILLDPKMTSEQRTEIFRQYAGENAHGVNLLFEQKVVLKNQQRAVENLFAKLGEFGKYSPEAKAQAKAALTELKARQQERVLSPTEMQAFLNDFADKVVGIHTDKAVAAKVFELSQKVAALKDVNPKMSGMSDEYLQAKAVLNNYIENQQPHSALKSIYRNMEVIGRNNLLMNPSTPIKAISGQVVNSIMEHTGRRLATLSLRGAASDVAKQARTEAWQTFRKTGLNTAMMESEDDAHVMVKGENFQTASSRNAKGIAGVAAKGVQYTAKLSNKIAIDLEHNLAFTKFYQNAFFDMTNITATKLARGEGLSGDALRNRTGEIVTDAARIKPQTAEGAMIRLEAQKQAARVTSTNSTVLSRVAGGLKASFPGGELIIPIAKIPATVVANALDNSGGGIPIAIKDIYQGHQKIQSPILETRYDGMAQMRNGIQRLIRIAGVLAVAAYLTSQYKKDDFKTDKYGVSYFKVGNRWIRTEYIAAISPAWAGMMTVKQNGSTGKQAAIDYGHGALSSLLTVPGFDEGKQLLDAITSKDYVANTTKYIHDFFTSRGEPAFIANLMKDRPIERLFFGASGAETTQEISQDTTTKKQTAIEKVDWNSNPSAKVAAFQKKVSSQSFQKANADFNKQYGAWYAKVVNTSAYKNLSATQQASTLANAHTVIEDKILRQYGFTYKAPKTSSATKQTEKALKPR